LIAAKMWGRATGIPNDWPRDSKVASQDFYPDAFPGKLSFGRSASAKESIENKQTGSVA